LSFDPCHPGISPWRFDASFRFSSSFSSSSAKFNACSRSRIEYLTPLHLNDDFISPHRASSDIGPIACDGIRVDCARDGDITAVEDFPY
jgi:hypothetical protein